MVAPWGDDWLSDEPEARYFGELAERKQSFTPAQTNYWRGQYTPMYNRYMGQLGQTAMGGGTPTQTWGNFLSGMPWQREWENLSPWQRGVDTQRFSPRLRWLYY